MAQGNSLLKLNKALCDIQPKSWKIVQRWWFKMKVGNLRSNQEVICDFWCIWGWPGSYLKDFYYLNPLAVIVNDVYMKVWTDFGIHVV